MGNAAAKPDLMPGSMTDSIAAEAALTELPTALPAAKARSINSVIFLDIDGVLNVGAEHSGELWLLNEANADIVKQAQGMLPTQMTEDSWCMIQKMAYVLQMRGDVVVGRDTQVHDKLTSRLVSILQAAGEDSAVVLSSTWRRACHIEKVRNLEKDISRLLGRPFAFAAKTQDCTETEAAHRLESVADFLVELSGQREGFARPLQALVLEDFFATGMDGWTVGDVRINSLADAEDYLLSRVGATASGPVQAKIVHCYEQWAISTPWAPEGMDVKVGSGLTSQLVNEAVAYLKGQYWELMSPKSQAKLSSDFNSGDSQATTASCASLASLEDVSMGF